MRARFVAGAALLAAACSSPAEPDAAGTAAGGSAGGGAGGPAGAAGAAVGGFSSGGSTGTAGTAGGGAGGSSGASGGVGGGSGGGATASAGCGKAGPPTGELMVDVGGNQARYIVTLPDGYDPNVPRPLVFGFHGRSRTHVEFQTVDASKIQMELGSQAVMAYLKSQGGNGWEGDTERELNIEFFELVLAKMQSEYCIDTSRLFAVGHSSGAHFANILACRYGDTLRGVGAVAGYLPESECTGRVAAMIIHGATDTQVANASGEAARDFYLAENGCESTSAASDVAPCVAYQGCDDGLPVEWCEHTEATYSDTNHGWPSFASEAFAEFFFALPP